MENQDRLDAFEQRLEAMAAKLESICGQDATPRAETKERSGGFCGRDRGRVFWGFVLIMGGLVWLADRMGWFDVDLPIAASALVVVGLYLIITARR